ncbi:hypothetical protein LRAMOSA05311 [Lichtheimia ramosa]|uniref:Checkpoint protein n=1 Tax=Lichtheimia ramosa TaxID=688394 RepID=A0A077X1N1_9FUNG|nr:hypothetical protein LRAMOSA05311 [Lichtheimia ramosa]
MRFKANLTNPTALHKIAQTFEKLGSTCIVALSNSTVQLIKLRDSDSGVQGWTKFDPSLIFQAFRIESAYNNHIYLSLAIDDLVRATRTAQQCSDIQLALRKKRNTTILDWSMVTQNRGGSTTIIGQEICVSLIPHDRWRTFREPLFGGYPDSYIRLPDLLTLKSSASRLKSLSKYLIISANMEGTLRLRVETDLVQCESIYHHLENPRIENYTPSSDPADFQSVKISSEDFVNILNSHHLDPVRTVCAIHDKHQVTFYVYVDLEAHQSNPTFALAGTQETSVTFHLPVYHN